MYKIVMKITYGLVGFLPQLHLDGRIQLDQPGVQVHLLRISIVQVDGQGTWWLLEHQIQMIPEFVTKLAELGFTL